MASLQLFLFLGYFATAQAATALDCTNDYQKIFCQLAVKSCSRYTLDIQNRKGYGEYNCSLVECNRECCCSVGFYPVPGEKYDVKAFRGVEQVNSTTMDIFKSLKPKSPTINSVDEFEGIFTVRFNSSYTTETIKPSLKFEVTISKQGDTKKVSKRISPAIANGLLSYQISNDQLEPGTKYTVSVRSYWEHSQKFSDRSNELEFKTPIQQSSVLMWIVIGLSMFGVILCIPIYKCYTKLKKKFGDDYSKPKSFSLQVKKPELYKPKPVATSCVVVKTFIPSNDDQMQEKLHEESKARMTQNSSGDSSDPCYGHTEPIEFKAIINKALRNHLFGVVPRHLFPELSAVPLNKNVSGLSSNETSSESSGISNRSYFISPDQAMEEKGGSSVLQTDPSYRPYKVDPKRSSYAENTSLCSSSSSNVTPSSFSSCEPSGSHSFEDSYKPFPNKVEQTNVLISEELSSEPHQCLNVNQDEIVIKFPQLCFIPSPSVLQIPHFNMMSSDTSSPVMVRSDYKCV